MRYIIKMNIVQLETKKEANLELKKKETKPKKKQA